MRGVTFGTALALMLAAGFGVGLLTADGPIEVATVPLTIYITDAPVELSSLDVVVASVTAGPERVPLDIVDASFDLASLRGPDGAILLAQGDVPSEALGTIEVVFASAQATIDGTTFDLPLARPLLVEGIQTPAMAAPAFLVDVDLPTSLAVAPDGELVFAPTAGPTSAAPTPQDGTAPEWSVVPTRTDALADDLEPAGVALPAAGPVVPAAEGSDGVLAEGQTGIADNGTGAVPVTTDAVLEKGATLSWLVAFQGDMVSRNDMLSTVEQAGAVFVTSLRSMPVAHVLATHAQAELLAQAPNVERVEAEVPITYDDAESRIALRMPALTDPANGLKDSQGRPIDGRGIGIAVVDSGIDSTHREFRLGGLLGDNVVVDNRKVVSKAYVRMDNTDSTSGHGTHVAAIVAGQGASDPDARGIAHGSSLYGLGIGEASTTVWAAQAFDWIVQNHDRVDPPIRVVTNSWSAGTTYDPDSITTRFVARMVEDGMVVVFSAGNRGGEGIKPTTSAQCQIPDPGVICVAAYDDQGTGTRDGTIAPYSSRGAIALRDTWPDLSAPGTSIRSARPVAGTETGTGIPSYVERSGTSQAAPHVAGVAALVLQMDGRLSPGAVEALLKDTAYRFADGGAYDDGHYAKGHGLVDAYAAASRAE